MMRKNVSLLIIASLVALMGIYQTAQTQPDDNQDFYRDNCVEGEDCG